MRIFQAIALSVIGAGLIASCSSVKTSMDYNRNTNFTNYRSFKFAPHAFEIPVSDLNRNRLMRAIEAELATKGIMKTNEAPDFLVDINVSIEKKESAVGHTDYYGGGVYPYRWGTGFTTTRIDIREYLEGTLFIDLVDAPKKQLVWQGRGVSVIDPDAQNEEEKIRAAVKKILASYPPQR